MKNFKQWDAETNAEFRRMMRLLAGGFIFCVGLAVGTSASAATATFYPEPHVESVGADGSFNGVNATYATAVALTTATNGSSTGTAANMILNTSYTVPRHIYTFDTSALPDDATITAADLVLTATASYANADSPTLVVVSASPAASNDVALADFDTLGTTTFASIPLVSWTPSAANTFALNSTGLAYIDIDGPTSFGLRYDLDIAGTPPTGTNTAVINMADQSGTGSDPRLVITYTIPDPVTVGGDVETTVNKLLIGFAPVLCILLFLLGAYGWPFRKVRH